MKKKVFGLLKYLSSFSVEIRLKSVGLINIGFGRPEVSGELLLNLYLFVGPRNWRLGKGYDKEYGLNEIGLGPLFLLCWSY